MKANATFGSQISISKQPPTGSKIGTNVLNDSLCNAEMNKVTISVNQIGTADFKTITEAIASIPLHNTRRVIINIGPGVYRYVFFV